MEDENHDLWRDRNKVFVAGLPLHASDDDFFNKFNPFGDIFQAKVVCDKSTGRSRGFGFVTFSDYECALDAVEQMNQQKWENRTLNVRFLEAKKEQTAQTVKVQDIGKCPEGCRTLYLGNLSYNITEPIIRKLFAPYGEVQAVRFAEHITTGDFRGFGYIQFSESEACEKATALNGFIVMGRPLKLDYGSRNSEEVTEINEKMAKKLKKGICHKFQEGKCDRGDDCKFAHLIEKPVEDMMSNTYDASVSTNHPNDLPYVQSEEKGNYLTTLNDTEPDAPVCLNFTKGKCRRGELCRYRHVSNVDTSGEAIAQTEMKTKVVSVDNGTCSQKATLGKSEQHPTIVNENNVEFDAPICINYTKGKCRREDLCRYKHIRNDQSEQNCVAINTTNTMPSVHEELFGALLDQEKEIQQKEETEEIPVCKRFLEGRCKRGEKCRFLHKETNGTEKSSNSTAIAIDNDESDTKTKKKDQKEEKEGKRKRKRKHEETETDAKEEKKKSKEEKKKSNEEKRTSKEKKKK